MIAKFFKLVFIFLAALLWGLPSIGSNAQAKLTVATSPDEKALIAALQSKDLRAITRVLKTGCNTNIINDLVTSTSALELAVFCPGDAAVRVFLNNGADPNARIPYLGQTALLTTARYGYPRIMTELLMKGANPKVTDRLGDNLLICAVLGGNQAAIKLAMRYNKVNYQNSQKETALSKSIACNRPAIVDLLLAHGAKPDVLGRYGMLPIHDAVLTCPVAILNLLRHGARIDARSEDGYTPLMLAAANVNESSVKILIKHGADPSLTAPDGMNSLMLACAYRYDNDVVPSQDWEQTIASIVKILAARTRLGLKARDGGTALDIARREHHNLAAKVLEEMAAQRTTEP